MGVAVNRKAVFMSMTALLVIGVMYVSLQATGTGDGGEANRQQIQNIKQDWQQLIDAKLPQVLETQSREKLNLMARRAVNSPFTDEDQVLAAFMTCMTTDRCNDKEVDSSTDETIQVLSKMYDEELQYVSEMKLHNVTLEHVGPFHIQIRAYFNLSLYHDVSHAVIRKQVLVTKRMSTEGLVDPLATRRLNAGGLETYRQVNVFRGNSSYGNHALFEHSVKGTYVPDPRGPSYLERLTTNPSQSTFGTHSLMPPGFNESASSIDFEPVPDKGCVRAVPSEISESRTITLSERYVEFYNIRLDETTKVSGTCENLADAS